MTDDLIKAQAEYIVLLEKAYYETFSIAINRPYYKPNQEDILKGIELREKIKTLNNQHYE